VEPSPNLHAEITGAHPAPDTVAGCALAALAGATEWLNSPPLTAADLRGRVVLVEFWTCTCINWLRTRPFVRAWAQRYTADGLVVIGVHTPEFDFERDVENVRRTVVDLRVDHPVAVDNDYAVWDAFGNRYWPAFYLVDARGAVRHHRLGEGDYARTERVLRDLLTEAGADLAAPEPVPVDGWGVEAPADWDCLRSAATYLGHERAESFASSGGTAFFGARHVHVVPRRLQLDQWALSGDWTVGRQAAVLNLPPGRIACRFHARDLHLVMGPVVDGDAVRFRVRIDGEPPGAAHGLDVDARGDGTVTEQRLHHLVRQPHPITDRTFEITFLDVGIRAYAFAFG
jgi:thiol-disulfide isomerase/thioredoxin